MNSLLFRSKEGWGCRGVKFHVSVKHPSGEIQKKRKNPKWVRRIRWGPVSGSQPHLRDKLSGTHHDSFLKHENCLGGAASQWQACSGPQAPKPAFLAGAFSVHPSPFVMFSCGSATAHESQLFCIVKLNLFKDKQLEACFPGAGVTNHTRGPLALRVAHWAGPWLRGETSHELLTSRTPEGTALSSKVELFTNTVISPQMQLLLQLIKRTIKTTAISQVHRPQSSSQLSDAVLLPEGWAILGHSENDRKRLLNIWKP